MVQFLGENANGLDQMSIHADKAGLCGYPKHKSGIDLIQDTVARFRTSFKDEIEAACEEAAGSDFLKMMLTKDMGNLPWGEGAVLLGYVNARQLPQMHIINGKIKLVTEYIMTSPEIDRHKDLTQERVEKMMHISFRTSLDKARKNKFIEAKPGRPISFRMISKIFDDSTGKMIYQSDQDDWEENVQIEATRLRDERDPSIGIEPFLAEAEENLIDSGQKKPEAKLERAYDYFLQQIFGAGTEDIPFYKEKLKEAVIEAVDLFNQLFEDTQRLHNWLLQHFPNEKALHSGFRVDSYNEYRRYNIYQLLWIAIKGEIKEDGKAPEELDHTDAYIAQSIGYLAYLIYWLNSDDGFKLSRDNEVNQRIEEEIDREFWAEATEKQERKFSYWTSPDQKHVSPTLSQFTPVKQSIRPPRRVKEEYMSEGEFPEGFELLIWRNEARPKTLTSTILKVLSEQKHVSELSDHQRSEAIVNVSMNDLDLNPRKNPVRAQKFHDGLEHLAREHEKALGLVEDTSDCHYTEIPAGTFRIENKAKWNSAEGPPKKEFIAVKAYSAVAVDQDGKPIKNYSPERHPNAKIIRREFRIAPYDVWHPAKFAESSTISHNTYKWLSSLKVLLKSFPRSEFSEELKLFRAMIKLFEAKAIGDKCELYRVAKPSKSKK